MSCGKGTNTIGDHLTIKNKDFFFFVLGFFLFLFYLLALQELQNFACVHMPKLGTILTDYLWNYSA